MCITVPIRINLSMCIIAELGVACLICLPAYYIVSYWKGFVIMIYCIVLLSTTKGCLPYKVVFHQRLSTINVHLPSKVVFRQMLSFIKCCLP